MLLWREDFFSFFFSHLLPRLLDNVCERALHCAEVVLTGGVVAQVAAVPVVDGETEVLKK
jgi:hypothetical protein